MSFTTLGLSQPILRALKESGYTNPTPIQAQAIPHIIDHRDILAAAQTGTGKTAGFTLPILENLTRHKRTLHKKQIAVLILVPTRELAIQVHESVKTYGKHLHHRSAVIYGGVGINPQLAALRKGVEIVIATPGRLIDIAGQQGVDFSRIETLVLDEADRMLDMGFIHDIKRLMKMMPHKRQTLLFSATFSAEIKKLASGLLHDPALVEVARENSTAEQVSQVVHFVDKGRKKELLAHLIKASKWEQVLVFTRTKHGANKLTKQLEEKGITALAIHGNKSQGARVKALDSFKSRDIRVLVATDIAARGIDIDQLPHVVNYELPNVPEDYVHRIGRTGRAGRAGEAVSLVCIDEYEYLAGIEKLIKREIPKVLVDGFAPDPNIKPEPKEQKQGRKPGGRAQPRKDESKPKTSAPRPGGRSQPKKDESRPKASAPKADGRSSRSRTRNKGEKQ